MLISTPSCASLLEDDGRLLPYDAAQFTGFALSCPALEAPQFQPWWMQGCVADFAIYSADFFRILGF